MKSKRIAPAAFGTFLLLGGCIAAAAPAWSAPQQSAVWVGLEGSPNDPPAPKMGDHLQFRSIIRNNGPSSIDGLVAWISLVQVDKGQEQPVDLEDWSAHKAVTIAALAPGQSIATDWPMRLIQSGNYRVVVSAMSRTGTELTASPFVDFSVRTKPVVESARVLPIALGVPSLIAFSFLVRRRRRA